MRSLVTVLGAMQIMIFVSPVLAANRNDFLFNLKDTFNSPLASKFSLSSIVVTLALVVLLVLFFHYYSTEQNVRRTARDLKREKNHQPIASNQPNRKWFRLKTRVEFKWLPIDQVPKVRINRYKTDRLIDISGGGMCFATKEKLNYGDQINIILSTGEGEPLVMNGQVNRIGEDNASYTVSVEFIDIRDGQRDRIVAWILNRQRLEIHGEKPEENKLGSND